jgi:hypothetical protein
MLNYISVNSCAFVKKDQGRNIAPALIFFALICLKITLSIEIIKCHILLFTHPEVRRRPSPLSSRREGQSIADAMG